MDMEHLYTPTKFPWNPRKQQKEMSRAAREIMVKGKMIPTSAASSGGGGGGDGSLPFDAVVEILARLPVKSLVRFRCVCKPWCSLTFDPYFIKKHHCIASTSTSILFSYFRPLALYDIGEGDGEITEYAPPHSWEHLLPWHLDSNTVGGLICGSMASTIFLSNLSTGDLVQLPSPPMAYMDIVGLGFDLSTETYKLLRVYRIEELLDDFACDTLTVSANQEWRYLGPSPPLCSHNEVFYFDGFIHWIRNGSELRGAPVVVVAFDCKNETFSRIIIPESECFEEAALGSIKGHLCVAGMHNSCLKILMLEDYARGVWTTLYVINCTFLSDKLTLHQIMGIKDGMVLLQASCELGCKFTVYSYNLCRKVWSELVCRRKMIGWCFYTESLVSPRRLLNLHRE